MSKIRVLSNARRKLSSTFIRIPVPRSPVPHLLTSNSPPSDDERKAILDAIADATQRLTQLNTDALSDSANPERILKHRTLLLDFLLSHRALLGPIRLLPPELLQEIFLLYNETSTGYHRWIKPPFVLGQICRSWRRAAISLPGLWNQLPEFKLSASSRARSYTAFLETLLQRSGKAETLKVYIRAPWKEMKTPHPVIQTLALHAERIQSLVIESGVATVKLLGPMRGRLTHLRELELAFWTKSTYVAGSEDAMIDVFQDAPVLKRVSVLGRCPPGGEGALKLPWAQIEEYRERYDGGDLVPHVLLHANDVERGPLRSLEIVKNSHHTPPMIPPSTLEGLKRLRVRFDDPTDGAGRFFANLTVPAIEEVQLVFGGAVVPILTTMLQHSRRSRTLRRLAFRGTFVHSPSELRTLFGVVPQLEELDIEVTDGEGGFLDIFSDLSARPVLLPLLSKLSVHAKSASGIDDLMNGIAAARCEHAESDTMPAAGTSPTSIDFDLLTETRPLSSLKLTLPTRELRHTAQRLLNQWRAPARAKQFRDTAKLEMWKREMEGAYPVLFEDPMGVGVNRRVKEEMRGGRVPRFPKRWDGVLREVEGYDAFGFDSVSLRASKLHYTLLQITQSSIRYTMDSTNADYIKRAKRILNSWRPVLADHLAEYKWVMTNWSSLVYVPAESVIRASDDADDLLVYGVKDDQTRAEVFWPQGL